MLNILNIYTYTRVDLTRQDKRRSFTIRPYCSWCRVDIGQAVLAHPDYNRRGEAMGIPTYRNLYHKYEPIYIHTHSCAHTFAHILPLNLYGRGLGLIAAENEHVLTAISYAISRCFLSLLMT